jgi:hypothetical protein
MTNISNQSITNESMNIACFYIQWIKRFLFSEEKKRIDRLVTFEMKK